MSIPLRLTRLEAEARGALPPGERETAEMIFALVICDRCGHSCDPRTEPMHYLSRWRGSAEGDLCPGCAGT